MTLAASSMRTKRSGYGGSRTRTTLRTSSACATGSGAPPAADLATLRGRRRGGRKRGRTGGGGRRRLVSQHRACGVARVSRFVFSLTRPISPICQSPFFPYLTLKFFFLRAARNGWACSPRLRATLAPCDLATSLTARTDMALAGVRLRAAGRGGWPDASRM